MTPTEIRKVGETFSNKLTQTLADPEKFNDSINSLNIALPFAQLSMLCELAAQVAELNERLAAFAVKVKAV